MDEMIVKADMMVWNIKNFPVHQKIVLLACIRISNLKKNRNMLKTFVEYCNICDDLGIENTTYSDFETNIDYLKDFKFIKCRSYNDRLLITGIDHKDLYLEALLEDPIFKKD